MLNKDYKLKYSRVEREIVVQFVGHSVANKSYGCI